MAVVAHAGPRRKLPGDVLARLAAVDLAGVRKAAGLVLIAAGVGLLAGRGIGLLAAGILVGVGR